MLGELNSEINERLGERAGVRVRSCVSATELTTFKLGASVECLIECSSIGGLRWVLEILGRPEYSGRVPISAIGNGSNLLIARSPQGVVLHFVREFSQSVVILGGDGEFPASERWESCPEEVRHLIERRLEDTDHCAAQDEVLIYAGAGVSLMSLSRVWSERGYSGLEFAAGIPAQVGGGVIMNAGAHRSSISDVLRLVVVVDTDGDISVIPRAELSVGYRRGGIAREQFVVGAVLALRRGKDGANLEMIKALRSKNLNYRKSTQPLELPSAGSTFRNPEVREFENISSISPDAIDSVNGVVGAGYLLEEVGLKGFSMGGVGFSSKHANWIVKNLREGTPGQVMQLIAEGQRRVREQYGVNLHPELVIWE